MRITALEVDGFGVWSGLRLDHLSEGLNVFFGPNEAGKTTLMQFVRSVLYGFTSERRRYLPPLGGGRPGGSIHVVLDAPGEGPGIADDGRRQHVEGMLHSHGLSITGD